MIVTQGAPPPTFYNELTGVAGHRRGPVLCLIVTPISLRLPAPPRRELRRAGRKFVSEVPNAASEHKLFLRRFFPDLDDICARWAAADLAGCQNGIGVFRRGHFMAPAAYCSSAFAAAGSSPLEKPLRTQ